MCTSWPQACITPSVALANGKPRLLMDRQRVHVGADHEGGAGPAAFDGADDAGPANARLVRDATPIRVNSRATTPAVRTSSKANLRMGVDIAPDLDQMRLDPMPSRRR